LIFASQASKKFKDNYTLGFEYAKALLNNDQYEASVNTLKKLYILPFEGSGEGKTVYEQATLLSALELIQYRKYKEALVKIDDSMQWPENLGVGKPYEVDTRIQDYLTAYCFDKLGKKGGAIEYQHKVIAYTERNLADSSVNSILALTILQRNGQNSKAEELLSKIKAGVASVRTAQRWVIAMAEKNETALRTLDKEISANKYADIIKRIIKLP
jgi:hypothetical protein